MNPYQEAAFLMSQTACMLVEMEAMKVANVEREQRGLSPAYNEGHFQELIEKYGAHHNAALTTLRGGLT